MGAPLTASKDSDIYAHFLAVNTNYGSSIFMTVRRYLGQGAERIALVSFDVSSWAGETPDLVKLRLTYYSIAGIGETLWVYKLTTTDWVEAQVTWNKKSTGNDWAGGGAFSSSDFTVTNGASVITPSSSPIDWDVTTLVQDAIDNVINLNLVIMGVSPEIGSRTFRTKEHATVATRPKLFIPSRFVPNVSII